MPVAEPPTRPPEARVLSDGALARILTDLAAATLRTSRGAAAAEGGMPAIDEFDSIERVELAAAVSEAFCLHEAGVEDLLLARPTLGGWIDLIRQAWELGVEHVTFTTSGSTGAPKPCRHAVATLAQEVDALAARFADRQRVVALVPSHHIYGFLWTALLPDWLGVPVVDGRTWAPSRLADQLAPGDLVVGFPMRWGLLARSVASFPADVVGVTSTGPCAPETIRTLTTAAGLDMMAEVYGASETAGIGLRTRPADPYTLLPYWHREGEALVRTRPDGGADAPVVPQDRLEWTSDRAFRVLGRRDGVVQVAGTNVSPAAVAAGLREHPLVDDARVRLMRPDEGTRLKAFVVPAAEITDERRAELERWLRTTFSAPERPTALTFGPALPRTAAGKDADW